MVMLDRSASTPCAATSRPAQMLTSLHHCILRVVHRGQSPRSEVSSSDHRIHQVDAGQIISSACRSLLVASALDFDMAESTSTDRRTLERLRSSPPTNSEFTSA